ncbi:unnamed protein product [Prorocentrum cordatum]|uniref:Uncharacterized protein n=1 Tax=Prorocentrum cordatum TaxID=2364126 RepID=A0ABN9RAX5_9DINO|nr:unnamed protein product [Polarella glacialis]
MRSVSLWTLGLALLCPAPAEEPPAPEEAGGAAGSPRPSYYRVNSDIETIWQRPAAPGGVRGIFFVAHGCMHQGTDFFGDREPDGWLFEACARSNYGSCLGLPEEVRLREAALRRGYLVVAVSGGSGRQSCWHPGDEVRVAAALRHVRQAEGLPADVPVLAMGASSGGAFLGSLASLAPEDGGVQNLRCLVPQIMALQELPARRVPTLFVHMPRDGRTAEAVEAELAELRAAGVRAAEIRVEPRPVTVQLLRRCYAAEGALEVLQALSEQGLLDSRGFLVADPRERSWAHAVEAALGVDPASLEADESCLAEEFNIAWAVHEITSQYAEEQLDFCEGLAVGSGGVSEPVEATEARGKNLHRDAEPSRSGFLAPAATGALGPEWTRDSSKERPAGTEGAGSYNVSVYTPEQQARLGVDKWGKPAAPLHAVPADQAPAGPAPAAPAAPKGTKGAPEGSPPAAGLPDAQVLVFSGCSGTRVHVYNVYNGEHVPAVDLSVAEAQTKKVRPGLSSFAERGDLDGAQQSLEQLLAFADQLVAPHRRPAAPAVLKATAGLRSLPRAQAEAVLQRIREVLGKRTTCSRTAGQRSAPARRKLGWHGWRPTTSRAPLRTSPGARTPSAWWSSGALRRR